ncbi:MAG: class I SAM-dependent methyltransferase [Planctomycetaceae bacterium]|nr:class I SAM-dependent methyltransferase [Planctomycetaceae bacterium]
MSHLDIPSKQQLCEYYKRRYRREYHGEARPSSRRVLRAWRRGKTVFRQLRPFVRTGDRVFEIGGGLGCTVKAFELHGFDASGIEPGEDFQAFSRNQLGVRLENVTLDEVVPDPSYDFILLVHVIEHLPQPVKALRRIGSMLRPGGRLYIECPNIAARYVRPSGMFHFAHIYNFAPHTMAMLANSAGFRVAERLAADGDRNVQMILTPDRHVALEVDPEGCRTTLAALERYHVLRYHLRAGYLAGRLLAIATHASDRIMSDRRVNRIIQRCQEARLPAETLARAA